jgi:cysteinyl-tRNA synthetase
MPLRLYNTLSRAKEDFKPISSPVGLYTCGPTVYHYAHIGNLRTYIFEDLLKRTLLFNNYQVEHIMNVTDVGHLVGDQDMGEDKMEKGSAREGKTAWEIADFYLDQFKKDLEALRIIEPAIWCKATDYINEQIDLIKILEEKKYTYQTSDGVYYDTSKFPAYNKLSHLNLDELKEGARVERNDEKKNPTDFALWKFSPKDQKRQMEWESPWGKGFPGWHIECSAMSLHFLKDHLDIHCGGIDHINIHHTNEIAQSEAATGETFFNYWLHGALLNISDSEKMAKSDGNILLLEKVSEEQRVEPLAFRYACLLTHYRKPMTYKPEILGQAASALNNIRRSVENLGGQIGEIDTKFNEEFTEAVNDDLNMPQAVAVLQGLLKSDLSSEVKLGTIQHFDSVLGLDLIRTSSASDEIPSEIRELAAERERARLDQDWATSDILRTKIQKLGYSIEDRPEGVKIRMI